MWWAILNKKYISWVTMKTFPRTQATQESAVLLRGGSFTCVSSCEVRGGQTWRMPSRTGGTGRACVRCACGNDAWVRPSARTSIRSLPSCSGRASHLRAQRGKRFITQSWRKTFCLDAHSCVIAHRGSLVQEMKLTGVRAEMCLQVGAFGISFSAAGEAADVRGRALPRPCASPPFRFGLEQLQRRRGRREHHPLRAWLQAQTFVVHAESRMRGVVGHLHLGSLRMVRESCRCVILLRKVHGLAQVGLAVWGSLVIGTERRGHVAGCPRWDGHPRLLEGHHARNVPLLLDFAAALGHHSQNGTVTVHRWLHLDIVLAGEMHRVDVKSPLDAVVARNGIVVAAFGAEQLCHEAGAVRWRRGAMEVVRRVGWHRVSRRVHALVNGAHIFRHAVWAGCVGQDKIQI